MPESSEKDDTEIEETMASPGDSGAAEGLAGDELSVISPLSQNGYFPRHLHLTTEDHFSRRVDEAEFLAAAGPKVVLGEPGMGKTELIREFGRRLGIEPVGAVRFMLSKDPSKFVVQGKPLLIDALDEAMSRREGDAIDEILAQLEAAGAPDFILSCRENEWQARSATALAQAYGEPTIFSLEPLSREEAKAFLELRHSSVDAESVLSHLDKHNLYELYRNPLTLGLMGRVAETDTELPATRAALFERVCVLIWPEHNPDRQDFGLAQLGQEEALAAAGAVCAALLFAGAEGVTVAGAAQALPGDIRLAEVQTLPGATAARAILSSKLFQSAGVERIKPIHRVVAEYLAARWLGREVTTPRAQRRLVGQLHGGGAVPASLRGMHAWLAFHSRAMAEPVIRTDPFGILRYGEANSMSSRQADCLFDALCALAGEDPYFRASDWDAHTAGALMVPTLQGKIAGMINSTESNEHLRSLLIEATIGTPMAAELASDLEAILKSRARFYRERKDAAEALRPFRDEAWWLETIEQLRSMGDEDSTRLAARLVEMIGVSAVSPPLFVDVIFAEMGLTVCPFPRVNDRRSRTIRHYHPFVEGLPSQHVIETLDLITEYAAALVPKQSWEIENDIADLMADLIVKAIDNNLINESHAPQLWRWLGQLSEAARYHRNNKDELFQRLSDNTTLRRAVQHHALYEARSEKSLWMTSFEMEQRLVGLHSKPTDVAALLEKLADCDNKIEANREDWQDLVRIATRREGLEAGLVQTASLFAGDNKKLRAFLREHENPKPPKWEKEQERKAKERERKQRARVAMQKQDYLKHKDAMEAADLAYLTGPAEAYLGHFGDIPKELEPTERISDWLGEEVLKSALIGFEAALHRPDLPSPQTFAKGIAEGTGYTCSYLIMAGMLERQRTGKGFADLPRDVCISALLLCHNDWTWRRIEKLEPGLCEALEAEIFTDLEARKSFCRLWIEPYLAAKRENVSGLYKLANDREWHSAGSALAAEWLEKYTDLPESVELELIDCLTHAGAFAALASIAEERSKTVFRRYEHMLGWLAVDFLVRFETVRDAAATIGNDHPDFIWYLRNRVFLERRGALLPLSVEQREWVISKFRTSWPYATLLGSGSGDTNPYDATDFFRALINQLANDTSVEASDALHRLAGECHDTYTDLIRHMAAEQRQKRAEETFAPVSPAGLKQLLSDGPPSNIDDLKSLVLEELAVVQAKLRGEDIDQVRNFWGDTGVPYDENRCRDNLAGMVGPELARYEVSRITEADMPQNKRADLAYAKGQLQVPMEVKGQWHEDVWDAATGQLDLKYLIDWRSEQRGIYCVLWFGDQPSATGRRLHTHPDALPAPTTPEQMREMLIERIPEARRPLIDVVVLDFSSGRPKEKKTKNAKK